VLGMHDSSAMDGEKYGIAEAKLHPKFTNLSIYDDYDMAIITLNRKIQFNKNVKPICLPSANEVFSGRYGKRLFVDINCRLSGDTFPEKLSLKTFQKSLVDKNSAL
jgi:hypothetical protein